MTPSPSAATPRGRTSTCRRRSRGWGRGGAGARGGRPPPRRRDARSRRRRPPRPRRRTRRPRARAASAPPRSSSGLSASMRDERPAARTIAASRSTLRRRAGAHLDHLGDDAHGELGRRLRADGEADRRVDAGDGVVVEAGLAQRRHHARALGAARHEADVAGAECAAPARARPCRGRGRASRSRRRRARPRPRPPSAPSNGRARRAPPGTARAANSSRSSTTTTRKPSRRGAGATSPDVSGAADDGERRRFQRARQHGDAAVRAASRAVQPAPVARPPQRRRARTPRRRRGRRPRPAGSAPRVPPRRRHGEEPGAAPRVARLPQRRARLVQRGVARATYVMSTSAEPPQTISSSLPRPCRRGGGHEASGAPRARRGGLHHRVLEQAAADGAGDRPVASHEHLRAGGARRRALSPASFTRAKSSPAPSSVEDVVEDLSHVVATGTTACSVAASDATLAPRSRSRAGLVCQSPALSYDVEKGSSFSHHPPSRSPWAARPRARPRGRRSQRTRRESTVPGTIVVGAQWGDEGKGKIIDLLAEKADVVVALPGRQQRRAHHRA